MFFPGFFFKIVTSSKFLKKRPNRERSWQHAPWMKDTAGSSVFGMDIRVRQAGQNRLGHAHPGNICLPTGAGRLRADSEQAKEAQGCQADTEGDDEDGWKTACVHGMARCLEKDCHAHPPLPRSARYHGRRWMPLPSQPASRCRSRNRTPVIREGERRSLRDRKQYIWDGNERTPPTDHADRLIPISKWGRSSLEQRGGEQRDDDDDTHLGG